MIIQGTREGILKMMIEISQTYFVDLIYKTGKAASFNNSNALMIAIFNSIEGSSDAEPVCDIAEICDAGCAYNNYAEFCSQHNIKDPEEWTPFVKRCTPILTDKENNPNQLFWLWKRNSINIKQCTLFT